MFPSKTYRTVLKRGMVGHDVWALQLNLNDATYSVGSADGDFGPKTETALITFQKSNKLTVDGIAGLITQRSLALDLFRAGQARYSLPEGLLKGLVEGESGWAVGAVNWSVPGGVDCGFFQRRVTSDHYTDDYFKAAFRGGTQASISGAELRTLKDKFHGLPGAKTDQRAWELAVLNHNWPWGAEQLAEGKTLSTQDADWVIKIGVKGVSTPAQWADYYIESKTVYIVEWTK